MVVQYKVVIFSSAFIDLAGINWGYGYSGKSSFFDGQTSPPIVHRSIALEQRHQHSLLPGRLRVQIQGQNSERDLARLGYLSPITTLAEMSKIVVIEEKNSANTFYFNCSCGTDLRRTEVAMGITAAPQLSGVFVVGYSSCIFELTLSAFSSFLLPISVSVLGLVSMVCSWFLINRVGRRPTTLIGVSDLTVLLILIGIIDILPATRAGHAGPVYGQVACIIAFAFVYHISIGPM